MKSLSSWKLQRIVSGLTQAELARESQIALSKLRAIEQRKREPSIEEEERLLRVLNRDFASESHVEAR